MASRGKAVPTAIPDSHRKRNNGPRKMLLRPLPVDCWDWTEAFALQARARAIAEDPLPGLGWTYLGAGAQGPQASVTSRTKQLEHSLFISWINLLSRVSKSYRQAGRGVKGE